MLGDHQCSPTLPHNSTIYSTVQEDMQYTEDSIWGREIRIRQPLRGYRFALDALLLAHFIRTIDQEHLLEIGAGSGVITVLVSAMHSVGSVVAVEIQKELAELCEQNFAANRVSDARVLNEDVRKLDLPAESFDLIFTNPPYRKTGTGKLNPSQQKAIARHELSLTLKELFDCAQKLLKPSGRLSVILPYFREKDFHAETNLLKMSVWEWKYVHSFVNEPPAFFLVTVGKMQVETKTHPSLVIYSKPGEYTPEMKGLLER